MRKSAAMRMPAFGTNAALGNVRFSAGYEGEADISRQLRAYGSTNLNRRKKKLRQRGHRDSD
jgi:hypothetical protein